MTALELVLFLGSLGIIYAGAFAHGFRHGMKTGNRFEAWFDAYLDRRFPPAPVFPDDPPLTDPEAEVAAWCEANSGNFAPEMLHHVRWAWRVLADIEPADEEQKARAVALLTRHKAPMP